MKVLFFVHTYGEQNGIANHVSCLAKSLPEGVDYRVIFGKGKGLPFFSSLRPPFFELLEAWKADCDLIHIHGYGNFYSFFGALLSFAKGKPLVWTIHGYPRMRGARKALYRVYRHLMAPIIFARASALISVSSDIAPQLKAETSKPIALLPNGVDTDFFKPQKGYKSAQHACYVGRLDPDKRAERLLECASLPLLFIGSNEENTKERIGQEARRKGVSAEFSEVPFSQMPQQYERCRYVVLPSKYEGFPLTLLESVAMARPFISTDVGEVRATLSQLFPNPEKYILSGNIGEKISALEKEDLSRELEDARKRLSAYSWKSVAEKTNMIYRQALGQKSG